MNVAIIGAGRMGRWFIRFFLEQGASVVVSDKTEKELLKIRDEFGVDIADNVSAVESADKVMICVPIESFEGVTKEIRTHVKPDQMIMDICSIKQAPVEIMHKYITSGTTLGTHPMFGPSAKSIKAKNFILTPTNAKESELAYDFKTWLEQRKARVSIMTPRKHDELMSVVLGLSHFVGIVACDTLLSLDYFSEMEKVAGPSYRLLLALAEKVASQDHGFYASLQANLPRLEEIEHLFCEKAGDWLAITRSKDRSVLAEKMKSVKAKLKEVHRSPSARDEEIARALE